LPYSSSGGGIDAVAAAPTEAGHATMLARAVRQRHLAKRHAMRVSGSDSYALLFLYQQVDRAVFHSRCLLSFIASHTTSFGLTSIFRQRQASPSEICIRLSRAEVLRPN